MQSNFKTELVNDSLRSLIVKFPGPPGTPYEGGLWDVTVELPDDYPYKSPSVGFKNRIFHPNIEQTRGSVCLDVLNMTWTPIYGLVNVFEVFLPQLLAYPNASDPLNSEAGKAWFYSQTKQSDEYDKIVRKWVAKYAQPRAQSAEVPEPEEETRLDMDEESDSSLSSLELSE